MKKALPKGTGKWFLKMMAALLVYDKVFAPAADKAIQKVKGA